MSKINEIQKNKNPKTKIHKNSSSYLLDIMQKKSSLKSFIKKTPDEIYKKLYLGNKKHSENKSQLKSLGITSIFQISLKKEKKNFPEDFTYHQFLFNDSINVNLRDHIFPILKLLDEETKKGVVFIHCNKGVSRSPSVVIAFLMLYKGLEFKRAFDYVRTKRICVWPNDAFMVTLRSLKIEEIC